MEEEGTGEKWVRLEMLGGDRPFKNANSVIPAVISQLQKIDIPICTPWKHFARLNVLINQNIINSLIFHWIMI